MKIHLAINDEVTIMYRVTYVRRHKFKGHYYKKKYMTYRKDIKVSGWWSN